MRRTVVALVLALGLAGCTSSGGIAGPGVSAVESALRKDSVVRQALDRLGDNAKAQGLAYTCIAKALIRDADTSDLVAYVSGNKNISDLADSKIRTDIQNCATTALKQATGG